MMIKWMMVEEDVDNAEKLEVVFNVHQAKFMQHVLPVENWLQSEMIQLFIKHVFFAQTLFVTYIFHHVLEEECNCIR